eukprot:6527379-Prymnesium_polylepis.1
MELRVASSIAVREVGCGAELTAVHSPSASRSLPVDCFSRAERVRLQRGGDTSDRRIHWIA